MNLDLDQGQRQLTEAVRACDSAMPPEVSGWTVFDAVGITDLLTTESALGLLEWCLVLEELGAACRDLDLIRSVRTFLDVYAGRNPQARHAFDSWVRHARSHTGEKVLLTSEEIDGGAVRWSTASPALSGLADVLLEPCEAEAVHDRDLIACAAYALGVGQRCLELAQERAGERVIAGRRLSEYQATAHRVAESAVDIATARVALWRAAGQEEPAGYRVVAAVAAAVTACLNCAQGAVQTYGAAGTSDPLLMPLYHAAYRMPGICGSPRDLWQLAGARWLAGNRVDAVSGR